MLKKVSLFFSAAIFSASLVACGGGGSDCESLGKKFIDMAEKEMKKEGGSDEEMKLAKAMLPALKDEMVKQCKEQKWPEEYRKCIAKASSKEDFEKCGKPPTGGGDDKGADDKGGDENKDG